MVTVRVQLMRTLMETVYWMFSYRTEKVVSSHIPDIYALTVYSAKKDKTRNNNCIRVQALTRYGAPARGALVTLTTNTGISLTQVIDGGSGYLCQMEPVAHFGLGQYVAQSNIVTWTDGEKLTKILDSKEGANQLIVIKHPDRTSSFNSQALVSFKKYMPPPLPYSKVNICPLPPPHIASIFFAYL